MKEGVSEANVPELIILAILCRSVGGQAIGMDVGTEALWNITKNLGWLASHSLHTHV